jgi:DNA-binding NtrC family response regulator
VPPLRERREDVPDLVRHFLARFCAEEGKSIRMVASDAMALLNSFRWPGNVRQLENAVFRAVVLAEGDSVGAAEFPQIAALISTEPGDDRAPADAAREPATDLPCIPHTAGIAADAMPVGRHGDGALPILDEAGQVRPLEDIESELIRFAIAHYRGRMSEVARRLRIGRSTLYRKLEGLGLSDSGTDGSPHPVAAE